MNQIKIGVVLKELRKEKGLTQEEIAKLFNVSRRSVSRWETGSNMPDLEILISLADYYEVDLRRLLDGEIKREKMNDDVKETALKLSQYGGSKKENERRSLNNCFIAGGIGFLLLILNNQFELFEMIFNNPVDDFIAGALTGLAILFEIIGLYNINHEQNLKERKKKLFLNNKK